MKESSAPFEKRAHITRDETARALEAPEEFAEMLRQAHPTPARGKPRLIIQITGPTVDVIQTVRDIRDRMRPRAISLKKNKTEKNSEKLTGETIRAFIGF